MSKAARAQHDFGLVHGTNSMPTRRAAPTHCNSTSAAWRLKHTSRDAANGKRSDYMNKDASIDCAGEPGQHCWKHFDRSSISCTNTQATPQSGPGTSSTHRGTLLAKSLGSREHVNIDCAKAFWLVLASRNVCAQ